jgi:hypothetical protein
MHQPSTITAALEYLHPTQHRPYNYMHQPPDGQPWQNASYDHIPVPISDARAGAPSVEQEGYALFDAPSAVADFLDRDAVIRHYYPEATELALAASGARRAFVFDHLVRQRVPGPPQAFGRIDGQRPGAAGRVHCDFTTASAQRRLHQELGECAAQVTRYSIVNLWRSIRDPVLDAPLALCDARSVSPGDLVASDIYYPERAGEIYQVLYNPAHDWAYFPATTRDEVLIFRQYDSAMGENGGATPHAAFEHPDTPAGAPLRASIEIRCLLIYGD